MKTKLIATVVALAAFPFAAYAQSTAPAAPAGAPAAAPAPTVVPAPAPTATKAPNDAIAKIREACAADVQKFCATAEKGKGKMRECLDSHAKDLSATCKQARAARDANPQTKGKG